MMKSRILADLSCRNTKTSVGVIFTRTNFVTLKYVTDNWGTESNGFRLVITAVKDPKHECRDFRCHQKEFCVHPELMCDGISHCADGSDESTAKCSKNDAGYVLGISLPIFVVVSVSFLLILAALGVIAGLIFCRNRPSMQQSTPSHSQHPLHQVYSGSNGTSQVHVQKSTLVPGTTVITPMTVNWVHPVVLGYLVVWARLYCQAE
ncbi:hypothetical protein RUM43_009092 [Polyplax serrata]|uniref:Low-density lipoprotein receptor domain class A n=2 Tax=Polyplax serrata TaxID=468196 RepID=A0AAN8S4A3_POLSC